MNYASFIQKFTKYMNDDFNTGGAVGVLFELVKGLNQLADRGRLEDPRAADTTARAEFYEGAVLAKTFADFLGLNFARQQPAAAAGNDKLVAGLVQVIVDVRTALRAEAGKIAAKDDPVRAVLFDQATAIRKRLEALGVAVEDRP